MFDTDDLVRGVLTGVMGGRRKRSRKALRYLTGHGGGMLSNPATLLTVAGVAWGIFQTLPNQAPGTPAQSPAPPTAAPPLPDLPGAAGVPADALRMIRLAIAAASADGSLSEADRAK